MATNYPNLQPSMFQSQQFFPQPQGNIYLINNSLEMANVPTGVGVSAAVCLSEGVMYLKSMQNGSPVFIGYRITPFDNEKAPEAQTQSQKPNYEERLETLEKEINKLKQKAGSNLSELIQ